MFKKFSILFLIIIIIGVLFYKIIIRGNNRLTVYYYHGIWLPSSTKKINFLIYPFPIIIDDHVTNECEMDKRDYFRMLKRLEYRYFIRVDTVRKEPNLQGSMNYSDYMKIPDSLITKFPGSFGCKSNRGDGLGINSSLIDSNTVKVRIDTDWN